MTNDELGPSLAQDHDPVAALALERRHAAQLALREAQREAIELCARLSAAQRNAIVLACKGITAKRAAAMHSGSVHTVYTHRCDGMARLGVNTMPEAAVILTKAGLV